MTRLRGVVLPQYSLDWVRVIQPASFSLSVAANRIKPARLAAPFARAIDSAYRKRMAPGEQRWSAVSAAGIGQAGFTTQETDRNGFAAVVDRFIAQFPLRPEWVEGQLDYILGDAEQKPEQGELVYALVAARTGTLVGAFAYYARAGAIGRVLQVLALPGQAGPVIDCLVDHAAKRGLPGLRGRTQPVLMEAMLGRRIAFVHVASTVLHSRDPAIVQACRDGQGFFNGIAGEHWCRLIAGQFD